MSDAKSTVSESTAKPVKGRGIVWLVVIILLVVGGWYGYGKLQYDRKHVYTDNAQVQGRIVKILSPETGYIEKLQVSSNEPVKTGDLLVKLSDEFYRLEVQRAQARYNIIQSRLGDEEDKGLSSAQQSSAEAHFEVIQSQLAQAKAAVNDAQANYEKKQFEYSNDNINQNQLALAKANLDQAKDQLLTLQKEAYAAQQQVIEAQASGKLDGFGLDSAKAELQQAQKRLDYTAITSPITGVIAKQMAEPGALVEPGQYLMSVVSLNDIWLVANIKETDFMKVKQGAPVKITVDAFPGETFAGKVSSTSPATGGMFSLIPKDNASGNFIKVPALIPVRIDFVGLPQKQFHLLPGMSAEVEIQIIPEAIKLHESDTVKSVKQEAEEKASSSGQKEENKTGDAMHKSSSKSTDSAGAKSTPSAAEADTADQAQQESPKASSPSP